MNLAVMWMLACIRMQERVGRAGLLRVVVPGRVRVHLRLQDALRPVRRRHERRARTRYVRSSARWYAGFLRGG